MTGADRVLKRCDELAACTEEPGRITRRYATPALVEAARLVRGYMREAGLAAELDGALNVVGRYEGGAPGAPALLLGSHLDSVPDAGRYDGPLGVLSAIEVVARLHAAGRRLPVALEVAAFADEEGVRFGSDYIGSRALLGGLDAPTLALRDEAGTTLAEALAAVGGSPAALTAPVERPPRVGYLEVHIEQGPVLEAAGLPLGVVTAIAGQTRRRLSLVGVAGHAGTVPMALRHDALCAAAEFVLRVERAAQATPGLVATVGSLHVAPGAANVVPGAVELTVDVRHPDDARRLAALAAIQIEAGQIAARRGVTLTAETIADAPSTPLDAGLADDLAAAIAARGLEAPRLPSGAGHDAVAIGPHMPAAMLFVRCRGGISHHPDEAVEHADVALVLDVLADAVERVAARAGDAGGAPA
jgi:hydantoinase/carbamoylase family amidase